MVNRPDKLKPIIENNRREKMGPIMIDVTNFSNIQEALQGWQIKEIDGY